MNTDVASGSKSTAPDQDDLMMTIDTPSAHYPYGHCCRSSLCDSSPEQIILVSNQGRKQKTNLIILDIDLTILESAKGIHEVIKTQKFDSSEDLELLSIDLSNQYSIIFRRHFFETLEYIHNNRGFIADIVLYTRASADYAEQVTLGIEELFKAKYQNQSSKNEFTGNRLVYLSSFTMHF